LKRFSVSPVSSVLPVFIVFQNACTPGAKPAGFLIQNFSRYSWKSFFLSGKRPMSSANPVVREQGEDAAHQEARDRLRRVPGALERAGQLGERGGDIAADPRLVARGIEREGIGPDGAERRELRLVQRLQVDAIRGRLGERGPVGGAVEAPEARSASELAGIRGLHILSSTEARNELRTGGKSGSRRRDRRRRR